MRARASAVSSSIGPTFAFLFPIASPTASAARPAVAVSRRGKYLIIELSSGETLIMHLGMSGWFHVAPIGDRSREADPHDHVAFVMSSGQTVLFNDPRRFGFMDLAGEGRLAEYPSLSAMGPEPLSTRIRRRVARARLQGQEGVAQGRAPRSARRRRPRQHLRERSTASRALVAAQKGVDDRDGIRRAEEISDATGGIDQGGADERDQAARVALPIRALQGLRTRRTGLHAARLRRNNPPA